MDRWMGCGHRWGQRHPPDGMWSQMRTEAPLRMGMWSQMRTEAPLRMGCGHRWGQSTPPDGMWSQMRTEAPLRMGCDHRWGQRHPPTETPPVHLMAATYWNAFLFQLLLQLDLMWSQMRRRTLTTTKLNPKSSPRGVQLYLGSPIW